MLNINNYEKLKEHLLQEKYDCMEWLIDNLEGQTPYRQGYIVGQIRGYDDVIDIIRNALKYGE